MSVNINQGLLKFLKDTDDEKRIFILGDTASGKTTGTLKYFMEEKDTPLIYYITTRKADLSEKKIFLTETMKNYAIFFHDKPNSVEKTNVGGARKNIIHLMTIEKALYLIISQLEIKKRKYDYLENRENFVPPDLFVLDEIDSMSENSNYELLTAIINRYFPSSKVVYISAVVNEEYVKTKLANFLQLKNPNKDCYSIEKRKKRIVREFKPMNGTLKDEILKYLKIYSQNRSRFRQTIFIIPSIRTITEIPNISEITNLPGFKKNMEKFSNDISNEAEENSDLMNWKQYSSKDVKDSLKYNFGIMYSATNSNDREILLKLFNMGKIQLLIATNVIERGINVNANSLFLFETKFVKWTDRQIINFFGRVNRETRDEKEIPGNFFFISNNRTMYDFSIINKRNLTIKSSLEGYKTAIYCSYFKDLENYLLKPIVYIKRDIELFDYLTPFSDAIKYSIPPEIIRNNYKYFSEFLMASKDEDDKREILKNIIIRVRENVIIENILKYLYIKSLETFLDTNYNEMLINLKLIIDEVKKLKTHHVLIINESGKNSILQNEIENLPLIKEGKSVKNSMFFFNKNK